MTATPRRGSFAAALGGLVPHLWDPSRPDLRLRVVLAFLCLAVAKLVNVIIPFFYKGAVDALDARAGALVAVPLGLIAAYGGARVLSQGFGELRDAVFAKVAQHAVRTTALATFEHLHALSLRFHLERATGGLSRVIERGTKGIQFVLQFMTFNIVPTILEIALVAGILVWKFDVAFALVVTGTIVGYIVYTLAVTEWRTVYRREMNDRDTEANTKAIDSLLNYETVKYFGNEAHEARRFDESLKRYQTAAVKSTTSLSLLNVGQGAIIALGLVAVMVMAANGVKEGRLTTGDFVMVNTYLIQLYMPLNFLGFAYREIKQGLIDMEKMFDLLDVPADVVDHPGAAALAVTGGTVSFENVEFGYDPRRPILKGISFEVPAGQTVAIVGPSGAGKSTISRILFRFYDVKAGRVSIDGQDIREVTQSSLRAAIGIVPQDTVLFNDTIRYNIRYGRVDASDEEVEDAAKLAQIDGLIARLPDGFKTKVGERGLKLSGGEKQRVAIARAILKRPAIMLFDEATSALDTETEKELQKSLRAVSRNHTTLVIAHRLSTVIDADEILVLDQGEIVERGRHDALLATGRLYARMWQRQQEAAEMRERLQRAETDIVGLSAAENSA